MKRCCAAVTPKARCAPLSSPLASGSRIETKHKTVPVLLLYKGNYPPPTPCGVDVKRKQLPAKNIRFTPFCYTEWFNGTFIEKQESSGPKSAQRELWILMYAVDFPNIEQFVIALPRCCFQSSCYITSIYFWPQNYIYSTESSSGSLRG